MTIENKLKDCIPCMHEKVIELYIERYQCVDCKMEANTITAYNVHSRERKNRYS